MGRPLVNRHTNSTNQDLLRVTKTRVKNKSSLAKLTDVLVTSYYPHSEEGPPKGPFAPGS